MQTLRVMKRSILHPYRIAAVDETVATREGPVTARAGDYVLTGVEGEVWPIQAPKFLATYEIVAEGQCRKKPLQILAVQMDRAFAVKVSWQDSLLNGASADWLVQYGPDDYGVVGREIFAQSYEILGPSPEALSLDSPKLSISGEPATARA